MVSESILDLDVRICSVWYRRGCLSVWPRNLMRHDKDVVSALWAFVPSHIRYERNFLTIYQYELFST